MSAATRWALVPVVLLVLCVGGQVILVTASNAAPGLAVEPHYYEKAQRWDERQAQERRAADLGWRVDVEVVPGEVRVILDAGDAGDASDDQVIAPLAGATVELIALHPARPDRRFLLTLVERAPGRHVAPFRFEAPGAWELQVDVRRDGERTLRTFSREAP